MNSSLRSALGLLVLTVLAVMGFRALAPRKHAPAPKPDPVVAAAPAVPAQPRPVAIVRDTGSAASRGASLEFGDTMAAHQRAMDDAAFDRASGKGMTTKSTYTAPLYPETRGRTGSGNP